MSKLKTSSLNFVVPAFLFFILFSFFSYGQKYYDEKNFEYFIDYTTKTLKLNFQSYNIEGAFIKVQGKDFNEYLIVKGNDKIHWVIKPISQSLITGLEIVEGDYNDFIKEFEKDRKYKKTEILFSNLPSNNQMPEFNFISEYRMNSILLNEAEKIKEEEQRQNFKNNLDKLGFIDTYKIKIIKSSDLDYSRLDYYGKLYLTEIGITIETDIPSISLIRSTFDIPYCSPEKNQFSAKINVGYGDYLTLSLNKQNSTGAFTIRNGKSNSTTIFTIVE